MKKIGTEEEKREIIKLYDEGKSIRNIAKDLKRSFWFVYTRIDEYRDLKE